MGKSTRSQPQMEILDKRPITPCTCDVLQYEFVAWARGGHRYSGAVSPAVLFVGRALYRNTFLADSDEGVNRWRESEKRVLQKRNSGALCVTKGSILGLLRGLFADTLNPKRKTS